LIAALFLLSLGLSPAAADSKPNILFIFADDQAFHTVHSLGNDEIHTPNIDRLVSRGTTFTHAYNQGGWHGAVCVASRTMLNTGLNLWHAKDAEADLKEHWVPQRRMWSQLLADAGYQTFFSGKWHIKAPPQDIFEVVRHVRGGMPAQTDEGYDRPKSKDDKTWLPWDKSRGGFWQGGTHWSEVLGDDAVDYMALAKADPRPFFMYLAFNAPHDPRQSPKEFVDMYPAEQVRVPESFLPEYPYDIGSNKIRDEKLAPFPRTEYSVQVNRQEYYAIITHMDQQIGRILDALEQTGEADNTWIVFTADHGLACGHHGLLGKQNMFDHSMRVPFVICGPGVEGNRQIGRHIYLQDIMPTALQLAGAEVPQHVEYASLLPLLNAEASEPDSNISYGAYVDVQRMITVDDWKLILYPKIGRSLLYNLHQDPLEIQDLSEQEDALATKRRLFEVLLQEQLRTGDSLDLKKPFPELLAD
jgi:choline-sulfatase